MNRPVYLDYNATTPVDPRVLEGMLPFFSDRFGNASSASHAFGWEADEAVKEARERLASLLGAEAREIYFTSGATEAINLALKGVADAYRQKGRHIVTVATEHKAVMDTGLALSREGWEITTLPVGTDGILDVDDLRRAVRPDTILISAMWANNETGVLLPVDEISRIARENDVLFFSDATQAVGKVQVSVGQVDLLACSAHKFYGPKGVGALYVRRRNPRVRLTPLIDGGGQERGLRGGTLNVPAIVGMGVAAEVASRSLHDEANRLSTLRDKLEGALTDHLPDIAVNGSTERRLPQTTNIRFSGVRSPELMRVLRTLAVSAGSACSSATGRPSHVLKAMGLTDEEAFSSLRLSLGRYTTEEEIDNATEQIVSAVAALRGARVSA